MKTADHGLACLGLRYRPVRGRPNGRAGALARGEKCDQRLEEQGLIAGAEESQIVDRNLPEISRPENDESPMYLFLLNFYGKRKLLSNAPDINE